MSHHVNVERLEFEFGNILIAELNRPAQKNPLDVDTVGELLGIVATAIADPRTRGLVITGAGDAFSAGGDLKKYVSLYQNPADFRRFQQSIYRLCELLESGELITFAMVNGACVAGGLEVALACDFIVMAEGARIGDGHLKFGQLPGAGGSQRLCRAIGLQKAKEVLLTGKLYGAREALEMQLISRAVPLDTLREETLRLCQEVCRHSPLALKEMKNLVTLSQNHLREEALRREEDAVHVYATESEDAFEGLQSFIEKRAPRYLGS